MGNRIKLYRIRQNLTIDELSKRCNLSIGYISHLETGPRNNPSLKAMNRIAKALGKSIDEVFG